MKRKEKENKHVVGEEGDENVDKKNKREVVWKVIRKEDGTKVNKEDGENNDGNDQKNFGKRFLKQTKRKLMATNY